MLALTTWVNNDTIQKIGTQWSDMQTCRHNYHLIKSDKFFSDPSFVLFET